MGDRVEAVRYAEEALEIGRSLGDDRLIGNAARVSGLGRSETGQKKRLLTEAVAHLRRAGRPCRTAAGGSSTWLLSSWPMRTREAAAELLEEDLAICEELDLPSGAGTGLLRPG